MTTTQPIIVARNYAEMTDGIAMRIAELRVSHLSVDHACDLADGHTSKLMAPSPTKNFGPGTLDKFLDRLGLVLIVAVDPDRPPRITDTREISGEDSASPGEHRACALDPAENCFGKICAPSAEKRAEDG